MSTQTETTPAIVRMNPAGMPDASKAGYSQISIVEQGKLAFISGQVAWPHDGGETPATLSGQTELVMKHAKAALTALGATPHDIVLLRIYVVGMTAQTQAEAMPQLMAFLDGAQPSLTGIGVSALASPDLLLEMEMVVRLAA